MRQVATTGSQVINDRDATRKTKIKLDKLDIATQHFALKSTRNSSKLDKSVKSFKD